MNKLGCYSVQLDYSWEGVGLEFFQEIVSLRHRLAVCQVSMSYYACNWSKSLWCGGCGGGVVWCGGVVA